MLLRPYDPSPTRRPSSKAASSRSHPGDPRTLTDAKPTVARQAGVLGHLARTTRKNARDQGVVFAASELFRMESLLRAFRAHLLATPLDVRGDSYNGVLTMIEAMIQREALSRPQPQPQHPRSERSDFAREHSDDARARGVARPPPATAPLGASARGGRPVVLAVRRLDGDVRAPSTGGGRR